MRAARAAGLFFLIEPIRSLFSGVVLPLPSSLRKLPINEVNLLFQGRNFSLVPFQRLARNVQAHFFKTSPSANDVEVINPSFVRSGK